MSKNVFEYLDNSFSRIFTKNGLMSLKSSFLMGFGCMGISFLLFILLGISIYATFDGSTLIPLRLIAPLLVLLMFFIVGFLESSFYAIIVPRKFLFRQEALDNFYDDFRIWRTHLSKYFWFVTYYSTVQLLVPFILFLGGFLLYSIIELWVILYAIFAIFLYLYVSFRLSVTWYPMLFSKGKNFELFTYGWDLLGGKVYATFKLIFVFTFIVGIAAGITTYVAQLFIPDFTYLLLNPELNSSLESISKNDVTLQGLTGLLQVFFRTAFFPGMYSLIVFLFFTKIANVLQISMMQSFLGEYYLDLTKEKNSPSMN